MGRLSFSVISIQCDLCYNSWLPLLVSTHIVCERLSVMQHQALACRDFCSFCQEYPILGQELPHPNQMKIWSGLGTLGFELPRILPHPTPEHPLDECVGTNRCIPHGYRLVLYVHPHPFPDNFSNGQFEHLC